MFPPGGERVIAAGQHQIIPADARPLVRLACGHDDAPTGPNQCRKKPVSEQKARKVVQGKLLLQTILRGGVPAFGAAGIVDQGMEAAGAGAVEVLADAGAQIKRVFSPHEVCGIKPNLGVRRGGEDAVSGRFAPPGIAARRNDGKTTACQQTRGFQAYAGGCAGDDDRFHAVPPLSYAGFKPAPGMPEAQTA